MYPYIQSVNLYKHCRQMASVVLASILLSGCGSMLSGTGPYSSNITSGGGADTGLPYKMIDLSPVNVNEYSRKAPPPPSAKISKTGSTVIKLIPGDVMKIMISDSAEGGVFAPLVAGGTVFNNVRVSSDGTVTLPYAGTIKVDGFTLTQVDKAIRKELKGSVATDPQVHSELVGDLSGSVLVAGAVRTPGRFSSLQGPLTILDAINMAGGPLMEPHLINVTVRNGKVAYTVNYEDVLEGGNRQVAPRSEIIVDRARQRFVAMGSVKDPGLKDLPARNPSLLEVLGSVGGLDETKADPQGVFVFRVNPEPKDGEPAAEVFRLDMRKPESIFLARAFQVFPDDAVYVTNAPVYEWNKIISPIVQTIVLGRTLHRL